MEAEMNAELDAAEAPPWPPVYLAWRQKLAAYWSIAWLSGVVVFALMFLVTANWPADTPGVLFQFAGWAAYFAYLICQAFFVRRLVRKRYRSFRVDVVRDDVTSEPRLSMPETVQL
jgi:hypothetical protein